nr:MAG TPA: hypothetical protein [Caudoviricetes sp.]
MFILHKLRLSLPYFLVKVNTSSIFCILVTLCGVLVAFTKLPPYTSVHLT